MFQSLAENLPGIVFRVYLQENNRMEFFNDMLEPLTGYRKEELCDGYVCNIYPLIVDGDKPGILSVVQNAIENREPYEAEYCILHKDGGPRWFLERGQTVFGDSDTPLYIDGIILDITERRRAQEELSRQRELNENIIQTARVLVITIDSEGKITAFNDFAEKTTGYSRKEILGEYFCHYFFQPSMVPCDAHCASFVLGNKKSKIVRELPIICKDGSQRLISWQNASLTDSANKQIGVLAIGMDVTEKNILERRLLQNEKMATLGLLVAGITHEINNPNNFIMFNLPILQNYLDELLPIVDGFVAEHQDVEMLGMPYTEFRQDIFNILKNMEHGSNRINNTINRLHDFTRPRKQDSLSMADMHQVIESSIAFCKSQTDKTIKTVTVNLPDELPLVCTDPMVLEQVLINLIINATHAVDKRESCLDLNLQLGNSIHEHILIEVKDNGSGIPESLLSKIFEPFFTTKSAESGTGLGLFICKSMVEGLGGKLQAASIEGKETVFSIKLPKLELQQEEV